MNAKFRTNSAIEAKAIYDAKTNFRIKYSYFSLLTEEHMFFCSFSYLYPQMHTILKKGIAVLLLLLLFYNYGGYLFVYKMQDSLNRTAIEQQLNCKSSFQLLKITDPHQLVRLNNHEIIYQKQRYDVSKEFIRDGYLHFYCIHDQEEESLIAGLKDFVLHTMDVPVEKHHNSAPDYSKNPVKEFYATTKDFLFLHEAQENTTTSFLSFSLADVELKITSPPPKTLF